MRTLCTPTCSQCKVAWKWPLPSASVTGTACTLPSGAVTVQLTASCPVILRPPAACPSHVQALLDRMWNLNLPHALHVGSYGNC